VLGIVAQLYCVSDINTKIFHDLFFIITVTTNVLATGAIAWKLLRLRLSLYRSNKAHDSLTSRASGVVMILAESAMLYTILGLVFIPTLWYGNAAASILGTVFTCLAVSASMDHTNITETDHPVSQSCRHHPIHFYDYLDTETLVNHAFGPFYADHIREGDGAGSRHIVSTTRTRHSYEWQ
jgi:hypothetical protein